MKKITIGSCLPMTFGNILDNITKVVYCLFFVSMASCPSCIEQNQTEEHYGLPIVDVSQASINQILSWHVLGSFSEEIEDSLLQNPELLVKMSNPDTLNSLWRNESYVPQYNQMDFKEVFGMIHSDSLLHRTIYLISNIISPIDRDLFLNVNTRMYFDHYLNGVSLNRCDLQGDSYYPIHLSKGSNMYVVKTKVLNNETWIEAQIMDSLNATAMYLSGQSNNIVFPEVNPKTKTLVLTNAHQNAPGGIASLQVCDAKGFEIFNTILPKDTFSYYLPQLKDSAVYMCTLTINGHTVRQPFVCGNFDSFYNIYNHRKGKIHSGSIRAHEIDQLLYRFKFLLGHESRRHDWWWQFKISPIIYQLEQSFLNMYQKIGEDSNAFNVQFVTYQSELDNGIQRYLLVTPDKIKKNQKYPLVVIVRPHVINHYPFFVSPQFAHQWAINIIQGLANRYQCIVVLPEARMYLNEDLTPFAEAEMKLAISHVKQHYNIDERKVFLHGICSGGYRALKMAALNPDMFAGVGVYAPSYNNEVKTDWEQNHSLESVISNLRNIPLFIFADPFDQHTPTSTYTTLIDNCRYYGVPLTVSYKINTELLYNSVVAGREAFEFFSGITKAGNMSKSQNWNPPCSAVVDFYSKPFVYVYSNANTNSHQMGLINTMKSVYEKHMNTTMPIVEERKLTDELLYTKNLFLIGDKFSNNELMRLVRNAEYECLGLLKNGTNSISIHHIPNNPNRVYLWSKIYNNDNRVQAYPWVVGTKKIIYTNE